jgi:hypothetical protein
MIGHLARRSEQIENKVREQTDLGDRFVTANVRHAHQNERKCWLARIRRLIAR